MEQIISWIKDHLLEVAVPTSIVIGFAYIRIKSIQTKIRGKNNNNQIAGGDIKNSSIRGKKNKVNIK
jgi:hypothetical protein